VSMPSGEEPFEQPIATTIVQKSDTLVRLALPHV